jgi:hypothetical protein
MKTPSWRGAFPQGGTGGSFPGDGAAGGDADNSPPSRAGVRAVPPLPHTPSWRCS